MDVHFGYIPGRMDVQTMDTIWTERPNGPPLEYTNENLLDVHRTFLFEYLVFNFLDNERPLDIMRLQ